MNSEKLQNEKLNIIRWINDLDDLTVVEQLKKIMSLTQEKHLSQEQKNAIDEAFVSINTHGTLSNEIVQENTKKRFPHLFKK